MMLSSKTQKPFVASRRQAPRAVRVQASSGDGNPMMNAMLASMVVLSTTLEPVIMPAAAWADEAELTPYERRQLENERRRDLLRQARAKAEGSSAVDKAEATAAADEEVEAANEQRRASQSVRKLSVDAYDKEAAKSFKIVTPPPPPPPAPAAEEIKLPDFGGFKFDLPKMPEMPAPEAPKPAPAPVVVAPTPAPAPAFTRPAPPPPPPKVEAAKKVEAPKPAPEAQKPGKRKGPLPTAVAELVVLGMLAGVAVAFTKYSDETDKVLAASWKLIQSLYQQVEAATAKK